MPPSTIMSWALSDVLLMQKYWTWQSNKSKDAEARVQDANLNAMLGG